MATPETRSVELDPLAPSLEGDPNAVQSEASRVVEPDSRELVELPSGPHTVLFVHAERGRMSVTVNVRPGQTTSASADF